MKEYILLFRMDIISPDKQPTPEQMQVYMQQWSVWIDDISSAGKLAEGGNHLSPNGRVLVKDQLTEGPHVAGGNSVAGYILILADDLEDATRIAYKCPILLGENTSVEIREVGIPG